MGGHGGSSGDSWDYRLDLGQQCLGVFNAVSLASQRDRAEEAQVRSGATTWSAWQRRIECSFPGENARSWEALGEARPGQSSLSAGALRYRAWAQSWSSAALAVPS